ncbi:MAG: hypothetical protein V1792_08770 [Pseudomonadota bacterium]
MKLFVFLGLVVLLVSSPVGMSSAKMYWDGSPETDAAVGVTDVEAKPPAKQDGTSLPKMYDDYKVLDIESDGGTRQDVSPVAAPVRRRPAATSVAPSPRQSPARPSAEGVRRPEATGSGPSQSISDRPKPVASAPGKGPRPEAGSIGDDLKTQASGPVETSSPPPTKKMPWGQADVKPAGPEKKKLEWGEK